MDKAIVYNTSDDQLVDYIGFNKEVEPPLVLQLGGNNPERLGEAVSIAERYGQFAEINLNNGCPSNKAKKAGFGAELMLEPELVRQILYNMKRRASHTEVTVKCRIGIQNKKESWDDLVTYIEACKAAGCRKVVVHSRVCVLSGLTPAQNRTIPPLRYDVVYRLIDMYPELKFVLNGGVKSVEEADCHMRGVGLQYQFQHHQQQLQQQTTTHDESYDRLEYDKLSQPYFCPNLGSQYVPLWSVALADRLKMIGEARGGTKLSSDIVHENISTVARGGGYRYHMNQGMSSTNESELSHSDNSEYSSTTPFSLSDISPDEYFNQGGACLAGVMIGREAYNNPWSLADADRLFFNKSNPGLSRREVLQRYCDHTCAAQDSGHAKNSDAVLCKPLHNFFYGCRTNKLFKQKFDDLIKRKTEKKQSKTSTKVRKVRVYDCSLS